MLFTSSMVTLLVVMGMMQSLQNPQSVLIPVMMDTAVMMGTALMALPRLAIGVVLLGRGATFLERYLPWRQRLGPNGKGKEQQGPGRRVAPILHRGYNLVAMRGHRTIDYFARGLDEVTLGARYVGTRIGERARQALHPTQIGGSTGGLTNPHPHPHAIFSEWAPTYPVEFLQHAPAPLPPFWSAGMDAYWYPWGYGYEPYASGSSTHESVSAEPPLSLDDSALVDDVTRFFAIIEYLDENKCLQKLVCTSHAKAKAKAELAIYESSIVSAFLALESFMPQRAELSSATDYRVAARLGHTAEAGVQFCEEYYKSCGLKSGEIVQLNDKVQSESQNKDI